ICVLTEYVGHRENGRVSSVDSRFTLDEAVICAVMVPMRLIHHGVFVVSIHGMVILARLVDLRRENIGDRDSRRVSRINS
ncbi:hypothetical protein NPS74_21360, partial [Cutibacterium acnes subsp. acnes]|nr:hypothetical protein [Cutibacterium acnes subsp. acnes]